MRRWLHRHPMLANLLMIVVVIAPGYLRLEQAINKAEHATEQLIEQRTESRAANCATLKAISIAHNALVESHNTFVQFLATDGGRRPIDPEDQALVDTEVARNNANLVSVPDCSPAGLAQLPGEPDSR